MYNETLHGFQDDSGTSEALELTHDTLEQCRGGQDIPQWLLDLSELMTQERIQRERFGGVHGGSQIDRAAREAHAKDGTLDLLGVPVSGA